MKKILSLLLCLVLASLMLISCADDEIGSALKDYDYKPPVVEDLSLNMYIITDDVTVKNAIDTVSQMISSYTATSMHTTLNVYYLTEAEYNTKVIEKIDSTGADAANIVLINNKSMIDSLVSAKKLVDLTSYLDSDDFGTLNVQITEALLDGSKIGDKIYSIPNNRVIGNYEYLVVNKEVATQILKFAPSDILQYKSLDDAKNLIEKIDELYGADSHKNYVYTCKGGYELKAAIEAEGNVCNVISYPTVTPEVAFSSAFAVINREEKYNTRAMQIIYAINTDAYLRNLLQYGVKGTNYNVDPATGDIVRVKDTENLYSMKLIYTGDVFKAEYCTELGWTKSVSENGVKQNKESVTAE